jgi:hypothetical protein
VGRLVGKVMRWQMARAQKDGEGEDLGFGGPTSAPAEMRAEVGGAKQGRVGGW